MTHCDCVSSCLRRGGGAGDAGAVSSSVLDAPGELEIQPKRRSVVAPGQRRMPLVMLQHHGSPCFSQGTTTGRHNESGPVLVGIR